MIYVIIVIGAIWVIEGFFRDWHDMKMEDKIEDLEKEIKNKE